MIEKDVTKKINLTVAEANAISNIGRNALLAAIHTGELKSFRLGKRKILIPRKNLEAWIDGKVQQGMEAR